MRATVLCLLALPLLAGCDSGDGDAPAPLQRGDLGVADAGPDAGPSCDDSRPPLIMAHGFLASGDTWATQAQRFASNGHCPERYLAFDWDSLDRRADHAAALDAVVDATRARFGADTVDLMGHSAGGGLGYTYLADPARAAKISHYVHVGSSPESTPPGPEGAPVATLNLWSPGDTVVAGADIPGVDNRSLPDLDHYAVATSPASFDALYRFLYDAAPATTDIEAGAPIQIAGVAGNLGDNQPAAGAQIDLWPIDARTGQRQGDRPEAQLVADDAGRWGPVDVQPDTHYELHVTPTAGGRQVHYYREPFVRSNGLVYLRTLPSEGLAGVLLNAIPFANAHSVVVIFSASQAVLAGRDTLALNGEALATDALASPEDTLIALFAYDDQVDAEDGDQIAAFEGFPFLNAIDRYIPADAQGTLTAELNGRFLAAPRWPSAADGAVIFVFD